MNLRISSSGFYPLIWRLCPLLTFNFHSKILKKVWSRAFRLLRGSAETALVKVTIRHFQTFIFLGLSAAFETVNSPSPCSQDTALSDFLPTFLSFLFHPCISRDGFGCSVISIKNPGSFLWIWFSGTSLCGHQVAVKPLVGNICTYHQDSVPYISCRFTTEAFPDFPYKMLLYLNPFSLFPLFCFFVLGIINS